MNTKNIQEYRAQLYGFQLALCIYEKRIAFVLDLFFNVCSAMILFKHKYFHTRPKFSHFHEMQCFGQSTLKKKTFQDEKAWPQKNNDYYVIYTWKTAIWT